MARSKPTVTANPGADQYSASNEKIIEYSAPDGSGGLISFRWMYTEAADAGVLQVELYRHDPAVKIIIGDATG